MPKRRTSAQKGKYYSSGRVKRGPAPACDLKRKSYRKALQALRRDFEDRCAYCMRHIGTETEMQVDHFDPRRKKDKVQVYANLFLSDAHCNGAKGDTWPTPDEMAEGCRFLNCCDEVDYGKVLFEDPKTHRLVGKTPAAIYHIEMIDLNDPGLIDERSHRSEIAARIKFLKGRIENDNAALQTLKKVEELFRHSIPDIPAPPGYWTL